MCELVLVEFLVQRHNHAGTADYSQIALRPFVAILADNADMLALEPELDECSAKSINICKHLAV